VRGTYYDECDDTNGNVFERMTRVCACVPVPVFYARQMMYSTRGFYLTPDMLKLVRAFPGSPSSAFHILCLPTETLLVSPSFLFLPCSTFSRIQPALPIR
jgi:hypothetical protein